MLESFNRALFLWVNATAQSPHGVVLLAVFLARYAILIVPLLTVAGWLWGVPGKVQSVWRERLLKTALALVIALGLSWLFGVLFPHPRPFAVGLGEQLLPHAADNSFPSDHGTVIFTYALGFLLWREVRAGAALLVAGLLIAWSRIYLGVHWPLDMLGAALTGLLACFICDLLWVRWGAGLFSVVCRWYRFCFALPIRKGWVRE